MRGDCLPPNAMGKAAHLARPGLMQHFAVAVRMQVVRRWRNGAGPIPAVLVNALMTGDAEHDTVVGRRKPSMALVPRESALIGYHMMGMLLLVIKGIAAKATLAILSEPRDAPGDRVELKRSGHVDSSRAACLASDSEWPCPDQLSATTSQSARSVIPSHWGRGTLLCHGLLQNLADGVVAERNNLLKLLFDRVKSLSAVIAGQLPVKGWHTYLKDFTLDELRTIQQHWRPHFRESPATPRSSSIDVRDLAEFCEWAKSRCGLL